MFCVKTYLKISNDVGGGEEFGLQLLNSLIQNR